MTATKLNLEIAQLVGDQSGAERADDDTEGRHGIDGTNFFDVHS